MIDVHCHGLYRVHNDSLSPNITDEIRGFSVIYLEKFI